MLQHRRNYLQSPTRQYWANSRTNRGTRCWMRWWIWAEVLDL